MKKTLHGKRHIRARRSVSVGRRKRFDRKLTRGAIEFEKAVKGFHGRMTAAFQELHDILRKAGLVVLSAAESTKNFETSASNFETRIEEI